MNNRCRMHDALDCEQCYVNKTPELSESELNDLLCAKGLTELANRICKHTPDGFEISLHIDSECAYVTLLSIKQQNNRVIGNIELPDSADKSLIEQLNDALCVANGFST